MLYTKYKYLGTIIIMKIYNYNYYNTRMNRFNNSVDLSGLNSWQILNFLYL